MPTFHATIILPRSVTEIFEFFIRPANLPQLAPPDTQMQLADGPEKLEIGSQLTWKGKRLGVPQQMTVEVTELQLEQSIILIQRKGPLPKWVHTQTFSETSTGTEVHDLIEFAAPTGLLGLMVNADFIKNDLQQSYAYREKKLRELFTEEP